jgi:glutamate racemase
LERDALKVAFFDSGIGGLTVLRHAINELPSNEFIYYADTKNVPYGNKPKPEVRKYVFEAVDFLCKFNIDALVVACNTATSAAIEDLRRTYDFPIIGMEPAVKPAVMNNKGKKIIVLATTLTLNESKLNSLIMSVDTNLKVTKMAMDKLVIYAEKFAFTSKDVKTYLQVKLNEVTINEFETIVLGCTHFIYFRDIIQNMVGPEINIIDGNIGTINNLKNKIQMGSNTISDNSKIQFYASGICESEERIKKMMMLINPGLPPRAVC